MNLQFIRSGLHVTADQPTSYPCHRQVEVIDPVEDYLALLEEVFDFNMLRKFITREDFSLEFDAMHAVTGAYAGPILVDALGAPASSIRFWPPWSVFSVDMQSTQICLAAALHSMCLVPEVATTSAACRCFVESAGMGPRWRTLGAATQTPTSHMLMTWWNSSGVSRPLTWVQPVTGMVTGT